MYPVFFEVDPRVLGFLSPWGGRAFEYFCFIDGLKIYIHT